MKSLRSVSLAYGLFFTLVTASQAADLTVTVTGAANQKGQVVAALFNNAATFPGESMVGQRAPADAQVKEGDSRAQLQLR